MKQITLLIILLTCASCAERITTQAQNISPKSDSPAPGWVAYKTPTEDELRCANYSRREWRVALNGEHLQVTQDPPPISKGERHVIRVNDGWLTGEDAGEFGGGLWWSSADRRQKKKLSNENVIGFVNSSKGVLAFTGLSHMGYDRGMVLRITGGPGSQRKAVELADLGWAPSAFVSESPDSVLVLTTDGITRVNTSGAVEQLYRTRYHLLYPTSMTLSSSGVIHIGMRHFITRLTPNGKTYDEEWFVPADCTKFTASQLDCVCAKQ
jgi:hypothetical protein